ncbi:PTS sugar transporter subunit IIB [Vagococcus sp. BWB3-3]|uniref:PTS sugar transporter subunit IIB n=1 Tax=Vagococcus allomyrinae TaxID=2794353 RepID=A0A940PGA9_9ENTE|nr:PTS sugar transporter subunit IIB [Vagococcus allomyrinae]MBP1044334.1 PTS sugar transporter subunit IIB [Vagococcus allomyrinae]
MKILAVCGFGVGSSMVLKMTLQKAVAELGLEAEVENTDVSSAKGSQADVIFTSNELLDELKGSTKSPIYPIKKYMDLVEVKAALEAYLSTQA